jgi:hypothetical protein
MSSTTTATPTLTPTTPTSSLGTFVKAALAVVVDDSLKDALPTINAYFNAIIANGSPENVVLQSNAFPADLLKALPGAEQNVISDLASLSENEVNALAAELQAKVNSAAS